VGASRVGAVPRRGWLLVALGLLALAATVVDGGQRAPAATRTASVQGDVFVSPSGRDDNPGTQSAPVQSLQRAQQLVQGLNQSMTADVTVVLEDGFYRLQSPLTLTAADSGNNGHRVIWTADSGARPVVAGSVQVVDWAPMAPDSPIWVAQAPAGLQTRQLYVNGTRAARAHGPDPVTLSQNSTGYTASAATLAGWRNPSGTKPQLEFVYTGGLGAWTEPRCPVASVSGTTVTMAQPCWTNSTTRACCFPDGRAYNLVGRMSITEQPTQVENAFQFLSASTPGQWFLDQGDSKLYYVPRPGETMSTADVEAPVLEKLVDGNGTPAAPIHDVTFNGIQFSYATWLGPNTGDGFSEIQANYQVTGPTGAARQGLCDVPPAGHHGDCPYAAWTQAPANVTFTYDQGIQLTNDAFVHLGAAGVELGDGSQHGLVQGNIVTDTSGSGIQLGNVDMPLATGSAQTLGDTITDNRVFDLPAEYHGGIGIDVGYAASSTIAHNQVDHTAYTAISMNWGGWPDKEKEPARPTFSHDNSVSNNLIFNHMSALNDGGAIYTQGITGSSLGNGEKVTGNLIHDQVGKGHVIYTDNGCTFETISGNGIYNTGPANAWGSRHTDYRPGATTTYDPTNVLNNYWENGASNTSSSGVTVSGNTAITSPSQIPASIVSNAGLEPAFRGLLSWTQAPLPPVGGADFSLTVSPQTQAVDAGATATYTVHTAVTSGTPGSVTLSGAGQPAGAAISFSPNPVAAGGDATMTVTTSAAATPAGSSTLTVTGTDAAGTATAGTTLVVNAQTGGLTLSGLAVNDPANAASWSLQTNLQPGNTVYGDRTYTVATVPAALAGAHWVRTANASKSATASPLVTFTISQGATVYLGVDTRTGKRPWMDASWVDTHTALTTHEGTATRTFELYSRAFPAGQVALGPNAATDSMYTITVV
jgi:hypothetical protein